MRHRFRPALVCLALLAAFSAAAQPATGQWDWVTAPLTSTGNQSSWVQTLDVARQRLYVLTVADSAQQVGATRVPAGINLHTFATATGQWLGAVPISPQYVLSGAHLALEPTTGDVILAGQFSGTLHLGALTLTSDSVNSWNSQELFVARYSPATSQWRWACQAGTSSNGPAACEGVAVLPGGDVVVGGAFMGDTLRIDTGLGTTPLLGGANYNTGFVGRLDGATGQWQWATAAKERAASGQMFFSNEPGTLHKLAFDEAAGEVLLAGLSDTTAAFGAQLLPGGPYLARLAVGTGQWVGAMPLPWPAAVITTDGVGNTYLAGCNYDSLTDTNNMSVTKLNAQHQAVWWHQEANPYVSAFSGGPMWQAATGIAADRWGNVFVTAQPDFFVICGSGPGGGYILPPYHTTVFDFDATTGDRRWRQSSAGTASNGAGPINVDEQGSAYLSGTYTEYTQFGNWLLPTISSTSYAPFIARLTDPSSRSRALGLPASAATTARLTLWPNPAHRTVRLTGTAAATATLVDALGRVVRTAPLPASGEVDLTGLAPGLYTVRAGTAARRLVVE